MTLFGIFMLAALLSLIYVATGLSRQSPPVNLAAVREALEPEATWTLRLQPFPDWLRELVAEPEGAKPDGRARPRLIQRIENNTHGVAQIVLLDGDADAPAWAVLVPLKHSQRLYAEPLRRALDQAREALADSDARTAGAEGRLLLASSQEVLVRVESAWDQAGLAAEAPTGEGMAPLAYTGPAALLTDYVDAQLQAAIAGWPTSSAQGLSVSITWDDAPSLAEAEAEVIVSGPLAVLRVLAPNSQPADAAAAEGTVRWRVKGLAPLPTPDGPPAPRDGEADSAEPGDDEEPATPQVVDGPEWMS